MGIKLQAKRKRSDTIVGRVSQSISALKTRNNIVLQMNKISNGYSSYSKRKGLNLFSSRYDITNL